MKMLPYVLALVANYYLLPVSARDTGIAMLLMLGIIPLITFICSVVCGLRNGFGLLLPITAMVLFAPTILIFYNDTAWIYVVAHGVIAFAGICVGHFFYNKR